MTRIPPTAAASIAAVAFALAGGAQAQTLAGPALLKALQGGGYVIVMRHASSPPTPPAPAQTDPSNLKHERQLDDAGKASATAMGESLRRLHIRIGDVWSSPTYRALETVRLAGLPKPKTAPELGDRGHSMQAAGSDQGAWLRAKADEPPRAGADTVIVTHQPNIAAAFGDAAAGLKDGEALVFRPSAKAPPALVARVPINAWPTLGGG